MQKTFCSYTTHLSKQESRRTISERHTAWLQKATLQARVTWKPIVWYRLSAKKFLAAWDNELKLCVGWEGLAHLTYDTTCARWSDAEWRRWPHCSRAIDQEGDGMSGMAAAKYRLKLNVTDIYDWVHGVCRDWEAATTVVNKWPFIVG